MRVDVRNRQPRCSSCFFVHEIKRPTITSCRLKREKGDHESTKDENTKRKIQFRRRHAQKSMGLITGVRASSLIPLQIHLTDSHSCFCFFRAFVFRTFVIHSIPSISTTDRDRSDGKTLRSFLTLLIDITQDHLKWEPDDSTRRRP